MKKMWVLALLIPLVLTLCVTAKAAEPVEFVSSVQELNVALDYYKNSHDTAVITLAKDAVLDFSTWNSATLTQGGSLTLDGNGATIKGLTKPLFATINSRNVTIQNLTIQEATIKNNWEETSGLKCSGAFASFVGYGNAQLTLKNCKLLDSSVAENDYIGGFVGYASTTSGDNTAKVIITDCAVEDVTITAGGSCGLLVGHFAGTDLNVTNTKVSGTNSVTCTDENNGRPDKVGILIGRVNTGKATLTNVEVSGKTIISPAGTNPQRIIGDLVEGKNKPTATVSGGTYPADSLVTDNKDGVEDEITGKDTAHEHAWDSTAWASDGDGHWHACTSDCPIADNTLKDGYSAHSGGTATCQEAAKCTACGTAYGAKADHNWDTTWSTDDKNHWHKCLTANCTEVKDQAEHTSTGDHVATYTAKAKCDTCGVEYGDVKTRPHGGGGGGGGSTTKLESPKTFDGGIALYAGMALSSALGAAYVSKKK